MVTPCRATVLSHFRITGDRADAMLADRRRGRVLRQERRALGITVDELDAFADAFEHKERNAAQQVIA